MNLQPASADQLTGIEVGNYCIWSRAVFLRRAENTSTSSAFPATVDTNTTPGTAILLHFAFPQLPVAIAIGGLTTFVLVSSSRVP